VRLLLDTQVAICALNDAKKLSAPSQSLIADETNDIFVSVVSIWEIAIKFPMAKRFGHPPFSSAVAMQAFYDAGFGTIDVNARHVVRVESLPPIHGDPFDRLLVAQAIDEPLWFLTADAILANYSELVILN